MKPGVSLVASRAERRDNRRRDPAKPLTDLTDGEVRRHVVDVERDRAGGLSTRRGSVRTNLVRLLYDGTRGFTSAAPKRT